MSERMGGNAQTGQVRMDGMRRVTRVLGAPVDQVSARELLRWVEAFLTDGRVHQIAYVNAECINRSVFDRRYATILEQADLVYPDGIGVVWASRLFGDPLPERVTLGDCLDQLCELCRRQGYKLFLLGSGPGVAKRAAAALRRKFPGLQIVGAYHGYVVAEKSDGIVEQINQAKPDILLVGMGVPKQEKWIWRHRDALRVPVLWGVGALFDYYAGVTPRAPGWLRQLGFEWFFRLLVEPRRLWRRYLLGNAFFILRACALLLIDAALVACAWFGAYAIRHQLNTLFGVPINPIGPYVNALPLLVGVWLVTCTGFGLYRRSVTMSVIGELAQVIRATFLGLLITMALAFLWREMNFGRSVILLFGWTMLILLTMSRMAARGCERQLARRGVGLRHAIIVGTGALASRLKEEIEAWPTGFDVVGFLSDGEGNQVVPASSVLGSIQELGQLICQRKIDDVFVASHNLELHEKLNLLCSQKRWPVSFHVVSGELESFAQRIPLGRVVELPLLDLPSVQANGWYEWGKRAFDVAAAAIGLILALPLGGWIALLIRMESTGPIVFSQRRVGKGGKLFTMYKFRTMDAHADPYAVAPNDIQDPRVTRVGRWLRRWSLDELPQLVNILRGDMSLVGPRPEMPFLARQYTSWQRQRLSVRPGLTGLWQVVGRKTLQLHRHIEYDLYYVRHRGCLLDLAILVRTIPAVLCRRGAY